MYGDQCREANQKRDRSRNQSHSEHWPGRDQGNRCADDEGKHQKHGLAHAIASREPPEKKAKKVVNESCSNPCESGLPGKQSLLRAD